MSYTESDLVLEELCVSNGLNLNELKSSSLSTQTRACENVKTIEMFFSGFNTAIMHVEKFPNLTKLKIIAQTLNHISGLDTCVNLNELWVAECQLTKIDGLKNCRNIKKLYLYSNRISKIENLNQFNLEILWLNDNKLTTIENIDHMTELVELNLAKNFIRNIGDTLGGLKNLETLNLASNLIHKFEEISYLQNLPSLKHLSFKDPQYGYNPITILCNYSLYIIYYLPGLKSLDTFQIGQKTVKELADSTINKKKLWYFMKLNTTKRELTEMIDRLHNLKQNECFNLHEQIIGLRCKIKDLQKELFLDRLSEDSTGAGIKDKESQIKTLEEKITELNRTINIIESKEEKAVKILKENTEFKRRCILMELENGGNIRFEFYLSLGSNANTNEAWYKSCCDLLISRFCVSDYSSKSINAIRINKVIRITNRVLLAKYEENFLADIDENDYINNKPNIRKKIDYLMYCWRPKMGSQVDELFDIVKSGFKDISDYKKHGYEEGIPFSNSLSISDYYRMEAAKNSQKSRFLNNLSYKYGYALLCKVFTNKFAQCTKGPNSLDNYDCDVGISPTIYGDCYGVKRQFKVEGDLRSSQHTMSMKQELLDMQRSCECKSKQTEYFLFKKDLAVPEYVIQFEYINSNAVEDVFEKELKQIEQESQQQKVTKNVEHPKRAEYKHAIDQAKLEAHTGELLSREIELQTPVAISAVQEGDMSHVIELNLHNMGIRNLDIETIRNLRMLKKLTLSFNRLTSLKDLNHMNSLEYLDVSYNEIEYLNGFKFVTKLNYLDLSHNRIGEIVPLCNNLKQFTPTLTYIDLSDNYIKRTDKLRSLVLYSLRSLEYYNREKLTDADKEFSENRSRLNKEMIKTNGFSINAKPRSLQYYFVSEMCGEASRSNSSVYLNNDSNSSLYDSISKMSFDSDVDLAKDTNNLFSKITTINLDNQGLFRLSNIDYLVNLRWASFNNNFIAKLEGLEKCSKLEELSLENNLIQSLHGIEGLENLRKLNVSNNEIANVDEAAHHAANHYQHHHHHTLNGENNKTNANWELNLTRLTHLCMTNNRLSNLRFVHKLSSLIELYAGFNRIKNLREIFHLKSLNALVIVDLSSNPMCADAKYRPFVVYHLKSLKSMDGHAIEPGEVNEARESFGGKLTSDFIAEKFAHTRLSDIRSLEFPNSLIRLVDLGPTTQLINEQFENLRSLNLENNLLTSFSGLIYLKNLKILCLNNNKIESIFSKSKPAANQQQQQQPSPQQQPAVNPVDPILPNLEVLHLAYNGISDLVALQISRLTSLKALFLQGNEIAKIEGLETLRDLRELVLDKNKIKQIGETSFVGQSHRLVELHIEENRLRDLLNIHTLRNLQKLYAANNKINEFSDIDKLLDLSHLHEISLINNPISRRPHYRITIVYRLRRVRVIDLVEVNDEDRLKAEIYFSEQQQQQQQYQQQIYYNGILQTTPQIIATQMVPGGGLVAMNNHFDNQFLNINQSPRLKPITILDKHMLTNPQIGAGSHNSNAGSNNSNKKANRNQNFQTRFRN